jgi:hypothetical protein
LRSTGTIVPTTRLQQSMQGFGDLVLLINPAVEASAYQRLHALGLGLRYADEQTPLMLTISAEDDEPRRGLFKAGRIAGEIFESKPYKDDRLERISEREALGVFEGQITHELHAADDNRRLKANALAGDPEAYCTDRSCTFDYYTWADWTGRYLRDDSLSAVDVNPANLRKIDCHDLSQHTVFGDVVLDAQQTAIAHQAFIVANARKSVITGHNGMFSKPLLQFLTSYIGFIEAKRFMRLALPERQCP